MTKTPTTQHPHESTLPPPVPPNATPPDGRSLRGRIKALKDRNERLVSIAFFAGGFVFDAIMLDRIDDGVMLIQQGAYLVLSGLLLAVTQKYAILNKEPPKWLKKPWHYVDHVIHFMLGTLLNAYTIFYFQSASGYTAMGYLVVIGGLLAVNEMPRFHRFGPVVIYALWSICLTSYFAYLIPLELHSIRPWMFYLSVLLALIPILPHYRWLARWSGDVKLALRQAVLPALIVQGLFALLYALRIAPPVPLAVKEMGIYHNVEKVPGEATWLLSYDRPMWKFWQKGDTDFRERPSDKVWCFARIFAPKGFLDTVSLVWFYHHPTRGWTRVYGLPLKLVQSGERGFAVDGYLTQPQPGDWRVEIQSVDERTVGQLHFTVTPDTDTEERAFKQIVNKSTVPEKAEAKKR